MHVVGTVALDTLAFVPRLATPETTGGVQRVHADLPGGTGGNVAMALARLRAAPRLLAAVGPDFAGSAYEGALRSAGVDLQRLQRTDTPTSRAYVFVDEEGRQVTYFYPGASREWRPPPDALDRAHFAAGEIARYPELMRRTSWVSFDPGQEVFHRELREIVACLEHVDLLFLNRHERRLLEERAGLPLKAILERGVATVVETRGSEGTVVHDATGSTPVPAAPASAVDPTGAGDAHRAGFLYALAQGAGTVDCARFASVLGAFVVEGVGPQATLPSLPQALARYEDAYGERPSFGR